MASGASDCPRCTGFHGPECLGSPQWPVLLADPALLSIPAAELAVLAGSDTSSAAVPAAVPGGGRGHKSPAPQPIRCLFPGEAWRHLLRSSLLSQSALGGVRELWEL